jgi:hypothetical protein
LNGLEKEQSLPATDIARAPSRVFGPRIKRPRFDILVFDNVIVVICGKDMAKELEPFRSVDAI